MKSSLQCPTAPAVNESKFQLGTHIHSGTFSLNVAAQFGRCLPVQCIVKSVSFEISINVVL